MNFLGSFFLIKWKSTSEKYLYRFNTNSALIWWFHCNHDVCFLSLFLLALSILTQTEKKLKKEKCVGSIYVSVLAPIPLSLKRKEMSSLSLSFWPIAKMSIFAALYTNLETHTTRTFFSNKKSKKVILIQRKNGMRDGVETGTWFGELWAPLWAQVSFFVCFSSFWYFLLFY